MRDHVKVVLKEALLLVEESKKFRAAYDDLESLLVKYINWVGQCEGTAFLAYSVDDHRVQSAVSRERNRKSPDTEMFTDEEWLKLNAIAGIKL